MVAREPQMYHCFIFVHIQKILINLYLFGVHNLSAIRKVAYI